MAQKGSIPYMEEQRSLWRPLMMKGNTQLPHWLEPPVELPVDPVVVVGVAVVVVVLLSEQVPDSSPRAAKANLLLVMTAALLEMSATPVGVPVTG